MRLACASPGGYRCSPHASIPASVSVEIVSLLRHCLCLCSCVSIPSTSLTLTNVWRDRILTKVCILTQHPFNQLCQLFSALLQHWSLKELNYNSLTTKQNKINKEPHCPDSTKASRPEAWVVPGSAWGRAPVYYELTSQAVPLAHTQTLSAIRKLS